VLNGVKEHQDDKLVGYLVLPGSGGNSTLAEANLALPQKREKKDNSEEYPGLLTALGIAVVAKAVTMEVDGHPALLDMAQGLLLKPLRKIHEATKDKAAPSLPTARGVRTIEGWVKDRGEKVTRLPDGQSLIGNGGVAAMVGKGAAEVAQRMMDAPIVADTLEGTIVPNQDELNLAKELATLELTGTPVAQLDARLKKEVIGRAQNILLDKIRDEIGADWDTISSGIQRMFAAKPAVTFIVDPLTRKVLPPENEVEKNSDQVSWQITTEGIRFIYYSKEPDKVTRKLKMKSKDFVLPWGRIALPGDAVKPDQLIGSVSYPRYVEALQARLSPFLRNLVTSFLSLNDVVGQIQFEPASGDPDPTTVEIFPLRVREPQKVLRSLGNIKKTFQAVRGAEAMVKSILEGEEAPMEPFVRPKLVQKLKDSMVGRARKQQRLDEVKALGPQLTRQIEELQAVLGKKTPGTEGYRRVNDQIKNTRTELEGLYDEYLKLTGQQRPTKS
jgi:hypothetical protein